MKTTSYQKLSLSRALLGLLTISMQISCSIPPEVSTSNQNIYFVEGKFGSDLNPGSETRPFQTIQKAADLVAPGNTVIVLAGHYSERVRITNSGASGARINFQADGKVSMKGFTIIANYISIDGFEVSDTPDAEEEGIGIFVRGSNCNIENNFIHYATRGGIFLYANPKNYAETSNCIVRDNRLYQNSQYGIEVQGIDNLIEGNEVWGTIQYHPRWVNPPSWVDADGIRFFGSGHILRKNYIHDILYGIPENKDPHIDCFQTWTDQNHFAGNNMVIEQNHCDNAQAQSPKEAGTGMMIQDSIGGLILRNNIIYAHVNIYLANDNDILIINNTLTSNTNLNPDFYPIGISINESNNIYLANNIFFNQPEHIVYISGGGLIFSNNNLIYRDDGRPLVSTDTYNHTNDLWNITPLFINPAAKDYHLQAISPAKDAGISVKEITNDYDGTTRPQGKGLDIGAFEWFSTP